MQICSVIFACCFLLYERDIVQATDIKCMEKAMTKPLKVCFFGDYDPTHNPTKTLVLGLQLQGATTVFCYTKLRTKKKYLDLFKQFRALRQDTDVVLVRFSDDRFMPLVARIVTWGKPLLWDA